MLNKQGPGKIDWTDYTWNPIAGKCKHNCSYCYMHRFWRLGDNAKRQIKDKYVQNNFPKKHAKIFVGSSTDMFGEWVHKDWIWRVINKVKMNPQHVFQFLTKNPQKYSQFKICYDDYLNHCWFGTSFDGLDFTKDNINILLDSISTNLIKFVSFEPLLHRPYIDPKTLESLDWIIIGADSNKGAEKPPITWAKYLIDMAKEVQTAVFVKDNYRYPIKIKEFPQQIKE